MTVERERLRVELEKMEGETFSLLDVAASQPDVGISAWQGFLKQELGLEAIDAEGLLFDRVRTITRLLGTRSREAKASASASRIQIGSLALTQRSCPSCALLHWKVHDVPLVCPRCQAPTKILETARGLAWSPETHAFIAEEAK
jgi:hypothetical protein